MSDKDSGDKTEKPTPKKLLDARKKGDVPRSKEVTSTIVLIGWLGIGAMAIGVASTRLAALYESLFAIVGQGWVTTGYAGAVRTLGSQAFELALLLVAITAIPAAALGLLTEFLQIGPILTFEKLKPKLENMNPVAGVKKIFSRDNVIELVKSLLKAGLLLTIGYLVIKSAIPDIAALSRTPAGVQAFGALTWTLTLKLVGFTALLFIFVAVLDTAYQHWSFTKKMMMSMHDIKQEYKENEGDPHVKAQRKQIAQEWSQRSQAAAAQGATALLVNPTHIAIAIQYDKDTCPVPIISAKGEEDVARVMREAAEDAGVPIVRNIPLARDLYARAEVGEVIPSDVFDVIAEVILWAKDVRAQVDAEKNKSLSDIPQRKRIAPPGEDLTRYPDQPWNPSH